MVEKYIYIATDVLAYETMLMVFNLVGFSKKNIYIIFFTKITFQCYGQSTQNSF